jgi:hypothetical protein
MGIWDGMAKQIKKGAEKQVKKNVGKYVTDAAEDALIKKSNDAILRKGKSVLADEINRGLAEELGSEAKIITASDLTQALKINDIEGLDNYNAKIRQRIKDEVYKTNESSLNDQIEEQVKGLSGKKKTAERKRLQSELRAKFDSDFDSQFGQIDMFGDEYVTIGSDGTRMLNAKKLHSDLTEEINATGYRAITESIESGNATVGDLRAFAGAMGIDASEMKTQKEIIEEIQKYGPNHTRSEELGIREKIKRQTLRKKDLHEAVAEKIGDRRDITREEYKRLKQEAYREEVDQLSIKDQNELRGREIEVENERKRRAQIKEGEKYYDEAALINKHIDNPASIYKLKPDQRRAALNEAFVSGGDGFVKNLSNAAVKDADLLYKLDADDDVISKIYSTVNSDEFIQEAIGSKLKKGGYRKQYKHFGKDWDKLNDAQKAALIDDFKNNELKAFNDAFSGETTTGFGPFKKTELTGEMDIQAGRQRYIRDQLGFDPSDKAHKKQVKRLGKLDDDKALNAYRAYHTQAMDVYNSGSTTVMPNAKDFYSKQGLDKDTMDTIMSGMNKHGIDSESKHTGLKVAAGIALGTVALWAASEVYDE